MPETQTAIESCAQDPRTPQSPRYSAQDHGRGGLRSGAATASAERQVGAGYGRADCRARTRID